MIVFHIIFFLNIFSNKCFCDVFTSVENMKSVLEIEKRFTGVLENYIEREKRKIKLLERYLTIQKEQHELSFKDVEYYISNPINAFHLIKRLTTDWEDLVPLINANHSQELFQNVSQFKNDSKFPTEEDSIGVAASLLRLQNTYRISEKSLIKGVIDGKQYNSTLSVSDCYELGRKAYFIKEFFRAVMWLKQADEKLKEKKDPFVKRENIFDILALSAYYCGYTELAISYTENLFKILPNNGRTLNNLAFFTKNPDKQEGTSTCKLKIIPSDLLCRYKMDAPRKITSNLKCSYVDNSNPYLLIGPFKVEQLHLKPRIDMFHDIIFENEIEYIKKLTLPKLERARVYGKTNGETTNNRIGKVAYLYNKASGDVMIQINKRISDMTGLDLTHSEALQVQNYGIGGFYVEHPDYYGERSLCEEDGDRIATVLIYLSDVEQGGSTVFSRINVTIFPKKGAAAVWHNLDPYGDVLTDTVHAACPVIYGSKWIATKWIHEAGQEFRRPCPLKKDTKYSNTNMK